MDLETDIQDEIAACENTQNWTGGRPIRTRWVDELKELDEALEALTRATQLKDEALYSETLDYDECCKAVEEATESFRAANKAAIDKQYELCEIVALRFADLDAIKDRVSYDYDVTPESTTFPLLVDEVRRNEWFFDDTINGHRDGAVITKDEAYIYANCRTFDIYADPRYVTYDLITKKLDRW